jgi:hypothetical protein
MKTQLLLLTLLTTTLSNAQITVTQADFANGGDTVRMSQSTDLAIDFSATGTNYNWDYSSLVPSTQILKDFRPSSQLSLLSSFMFGAFSPTKYKATYFMESTELPLDQLSTVLPVSITDVFQFTRNTADSLTSIGYSMVVNGTEIPFKSDTIEKRYDFPINFGNTTSSRGYTNMDLNPVYDAIWRQYRQHNSEVDGWGTITTPHGTFQALRIAHTIEELDSIYITFSGFSFWVPLAVPTSKIYEWWTNGQDEPILRINTSILGGTESVNAVEYRDVFRDLTAGLEEGVIKFEAFPNPVQSQLTINSKDDFNEIIIADITGKQIKAIKSDFKSQAILNVSDLSPGLYYLKMISGNNISVRSFVKE